MSTSGGGDYKDALDRYRADLERRRLNQDYWIVLLTNDLELLKAAFEFAGIAIKSLLLLNGAAAISTLTFIGNSTKNGDVDRTLFLPLVLFAAGALAGAFAAGMAYVAQILFFHDASGRTKEIIENREAGRGRWSLRFANLFRVVAAVAVLLGYTLFAFGLWHAARPFLDW